ncbi:MAG: DUF4230 domain-containing protein [Chitinophagaceae bacterium]
MRDPNTKYLLTAISIMVLIVSAIFLLGKYKLPSLVGLFSREPVKIQTTATIVEEINTIAQLMTIESYSEVVMDSVKYPKLGIAARLLKRNPALPQLLNVPRIVLIIKGKVTAGINLQKLSPDDVQVFGDSISIQLPKTEILDVIISPSGTETFTEKGNWTPEEIAQIKMEAKDKLLQHALEQDILFKAEEKSKAIIESLLQSAGFKKISINVTQPLQ